MVLDKTVLFAGSEPGNRYVFCSLVGSTLVLKDSLDLRLEFRKF